MQSLAHYKQQLLLRYGTELGDDTRARLDREVHETLGRLAEVDPMRRRRYEDLLGGNGGSAL